MHVRCPICRTSNEASAMNPDQDCFPTLPDLWFCPDIKSKAILTNRNVGAQNLFQKLDSRRRDAKLLN